MISFVRKYRHGLWMLFYSLFYIVIFRYLENRYVPAYHVVHTVFDDMIPFCEVFIVPYMLWFPYMVIAVLYFIFINKDKKEYWQLAGNMIMGMTVFLVVSYLYPNIQHLRPEILPRENIFADAVRALYATDTPTNILPSIHVFNSLAIHMSLTNCAAMRISDPYDPDHPVDHVPEAAFSHRCLPGQHHGIVRISFVLSGSGERAFSASGRNRTAELLSSKKGL